MPLLGPNHPNWKGGRILQRCERCGKEFLSYASSHRRFCSRSCHYEGAVKICERCGKEFHVKRGEVGHRKFCSAECFHPHLAGTCEFCGKEFRIRKGKTDQRFCSPECYNEYKKRQTVQHRVDDPNWGRKTAIYTCKACGKRFRGWPFQSKVGRGRFCSHECADQWRSKHLSGKNSPRWKDSIEYTTCKLCGKLFRKIYATRQCCSQECRRKWQKEQRIQRVCEGCGKILNLPPNAKNKRFCSRRCKGKWMSLHNTGSNHPTWKGGRLPYYGPNWESQRDLAWARDGNRCRLCGDNPTSDRKHIDTHHIRPFREFGYVPEENDHYLQANDLSNLICLCPKHHKKAESGKITREELYAAILAPAMEVSHEPSQAL